MKFWLHIHNTQPEDMVELAVLAEQLGFEGVLGDDHWFVSVPRHHPAFAGQPGSARQQVYPDMFVAGSAILAHTKTLKYGCCVMVLGNRTNPFMAAKSAATLARLSNDRFVLGVGIGWMREEYDVAEIDFKTRAPRTVEMIEILRKLWGPGPVEHRGRFFNFPPTSAEPRPGKPIPIYIGSMAAPALIRTGRIGDGWMGFPSTLADLPRQIELINQGRREAGRDNKPFEFMVGMKPSRPGVLPTADDYRRSQDLGITQHHIGPLEQVTGRPWLNLDEKKRMIEAFANEVIAKS